MAGFDPATLDRWRALAIVDRDGATVGTISEFYLDRETGYPTWALIETGLFGANLTFVPLVHATEISDGLQVPYEKRHIKDTPHVDIHDELSPDEETTLFAHYGIDYQPSAVPDPTTETQEPVPAEPGTVEGPGPVAATPPPTADPQPATPGSPGSPGSVDAEPRAAGSSEAADTEPGTSGSPGAVDADRGSAEAPGPVAAEPGSVAPAGVGDAEPRPAQYGSLEAIPVEPEPDDGTAGRYRARSEEADGTAPDEPGTADPDLSRTAPVEPGLPGSTAASPPGSPQATIDKDLPADSSDRPTEEPPQPPDEAGWAPGAAGSFEETEPVDRPAGSSDRWREAKEAAERDRIARTAAAQAEERSPLERARRRLERLVGVGQEPPDPDDISPAERDAAERARRARLGLEEDDRRR